MERSTLDWRRWRSELRYVAAGAAVAVLLAACGAPAPASTLPSSAPATTAPTAAASPGPTAAPAVTKRFTIAPDTVVDTRLLGTDDLYVNPGAVIEVDGVLHMFPNSFSKWPGRMRVPHLTSTDGLGVDARRGGRDPRHGDQGPLPDGQPGIDVSTGFVTDDGTWVLLFENVSPLTGGPWRISA